MYYPRQPLPTLPEQLQVDTLVYVVILKRKIKLLRSPGFHFKNSALVYASVTDPAQVSGGCAQKPERWTELCVIFSYFQKSLIVIVTLRKH